MLRSSSAHAGSEVRGRTRRVQPGAEGTEWCSRRLLAQALEAQAVVSVECDVPIGWSLDDYRQVRGLAREVNESLHQRGGACYHEHRADRAQQPTCTENRSQYDGRVRRSVLGALLLVTLVVAGVRRRLGLRRGRTVVATTTQVADLVRQVGGEPDLGRRDAPAGRRPARLRAAAERRGRGRQGRPRVPLGRRGGRLARRRDRQRGRRRARSCR